MNTSQTLATGTGRTSNGSISGSQQLKEVSTMTSTRTIGRDGWISIGVALLAVLALIATLQLAPWASRSLPLASAPAVTTNFSEVPRGFSDYITLRTNADRPNYSAAPAGMTDHAAPAARVNHSAAPAGMTDHPAPAAGINYSAAPAGMTDHAASAAPAARVNSSDVPRGFTDYQSLQAAARINPSRVPSGLTDYLSLQPKARVNPSQAPFGMTDHLSPTR